MGVVKTVLRIGNVAGSVLDADDRQVLGQLIIWAVGLFASAAIVGASIGILIRAVQFAAG